ncbi:MAG TPA: hypothetical protein PKE27_05755 [Povalibacter sp.]|uniref:hypothetical protein n=1 Tax=Povalibacter sp. TaxID=1962978 RepID=UPI002D1CBD0B|nr:hypothetical protein [Povalibacter sp.]HMN44053.1 hypothetical protein [Povalibacter sp.]
MQRVALALLVAFGLLAPWRAHACQGPWFETSFDTAAPTATDIVAVQVESLALETDPYRSIGQTFRGKVRVLKHYRGSGRFEDIRYTNSRCGGLHIDVGGIYLIATNSQTPTIELRADEAPIVALTGFFTFDPQPVLRLSDTVKQLEAALRGDGTFAITTDASRQQLSIFDPAPPVPPPEPIDTP